MGADLQLIAGAGAEKAGFRRLRDLRETVPIAMLDYWTRKRGDRLMPRPDEMDPVEFPALLPNIIVLKIAYDPFEITYRLMGEETIQANGGNFRGRTVTSLDEVRPFFGSMLFEFYKWVALARRPVGAGGSMEFAGRGFMNFEAVYLPLSMDGERTDRIFGATAYTSVSALERLRTEISTI